MEDEGNVAKVAVVDGVVVDSKAVDALLKAANEKDISIARLEKTTEAVVKLSEHGLSAWKDYQARKATTKETELLYEHEQHKRVTLMLGALIGVVFVLCITALLKDQYELVKWVLSSSFALAAGASLTSMLGKKKKPE